MFQKIFEAIDRGIQNALVIDDVNTGIHYHTAEKINSIGRDEKVQIIDELFNANNYAGIVNFVKNINYNVSYPANDNNFHTLVKQCISVDLYLNLNWIDTTAITNMSWLFQNSSFDGDISEWNVSNVKNMSGMFRNSKFTGQNGDITGWKLKNIMHIDMMFENAAYAGNLSNWAIPDIVSRRKAFFNCNCIKPKFKNISQLEKEIVVVKTLREARNLVHKAIQKYMRKNDPNDVCDLNWIDVSNLTSLDSLFKGIKCNFKIDVSRWDVTNVSRMTETFADSTFDGDISQWNVSNVTIMINMFNKNKCFNGDLSPWADKLSKLDYAGGMFSYSKYNRDISMWDVSNIKSMLRMFYHNTDFSYDLSGWNIQQKCQTNEMFYGCNENLPLPYWYKG